MIRKNKNGKHEKRLLILAISAFLFFHIQLASASFQLGNSSWIKEEYYPGQGIIGKINISFNQESTNYSFTNNFNSNTVTLEDFLDLNNAEYSCMPSDCTNAYELSSPGTSKIFELEYSDKVYSLNLKGNINEVRGLSFNLSVENPESCLSPLVIDVLGDGTYEWRANSFSNDFSCYYNNIYGCFDNESSTENVILGTTPYCQKITLTEGGKYSLGAWIKKGTTSFYNGLLKMQVYSLSGEIMEECDLPSPSATGSEINCSIEYLNQDMKEHYVCIGAEEETDYMIKMEQYADDACGFFGNPGEQTEYNDYWIFAKGARFSNIGNVEFNQEEYEAQGNSGEIAAYLDSYITERYSRNCSDGCAIPIRFISLNPHATTKVTINSVNLGYSTSSGIASPEARIYATKVTPAKINAGFIYLDLAHLNISAPKKYGWQNVTILLSGARIISKNVSVSDYPIVEKVTPTSFPAGVPVKFSVSVNSSKQISSYLWNFGDGQSAETTSNFTSHLYNQTGIYTLEVSVVDSSGRNTSFTTSVISGNPAASVNKTIKDYRARIDNLTRQMGGYSDWAKRAIEQSLNVSELDSQLRILERQLANAETEEEFVKISNGLLGIRVPISIEKSQEISFPLFIADGLINLDNLKELGAGSYDEELDYENGILEWSAGVTINLTAYKIIGRFDDEYRGIITSYKIISSQDNFFFVVMGNAAFNNLESEDFGDSVGVEIENGEAEFTIAGDNNPMELNAYYSPKFIDLNLKPVGVCKIDRKCDKAEGENWRNCRKDCLPWPKIIFYFFMLFIMAFILYVILEEWYKRKYENYLFKNRNDLYNIVNFVNNAMNRKLSEDAIKNALIGSGWNSEQIAYGIKKVKGRRTGMPIEFSFKILTQKEKAFKPKNIE